MVFHPERENIPALFTAKTMERLPFSAHCERRVFFSMKRAKSHVVSSGFPEPYELADEFYDIGCPSDLFFRGLIGNHLSLAEALPAAIAMIEKMESALRYESSKRR
jgi:hypothetical protein